VQQRGDRFESAPAGTDIGQTDRIAIDLPAVDAAALTLSRDPDQGWIAKVGPSYRPARNDSVEHLLTALAQLRTTRVAANSPGGYRRLGIETLREYRFTYFDHHDKMVQWALFAPPDSLVDSLAGYLLIIPAPELYTLTGPDIRTLPWQSDRLFGHELLRLEPTRRADSIVLLRADTTLRRRLPASDSLVRSWQALDGPRLADDVDEMAAADRRLAEVRLYFPGSDSISLYGLRSRDGGQTFNVYSSQFSRNYFSVDNAWFETIFGPVQLPPADTSGVF
ncbi:MAG: hypothetical protein WBA17_15665, partial [Saprospiraceae bacterium]